MPQPLRISKERPDAFWQTVRDRIDQAQAATVINNALHANGETPTEQQFKAACFVINKFCPSLQALAVSIEDMRPASINDLQARAAMLGLDTTAILGDPNAILPDSNANASVEDKTPLEVECVQVDSVDSDTQTVPGESETGQDDTSD